MVDRNELRRARLNLMAEVSGRLGGTTNIANKISIVMLLLIFLTLTNYGFFFTDAESYSASQSGDRNLIVSAGGYLRYLVLGGATFALLVSFVSKKVFLAKNLYIKNFPLQFKISLIFVLMIIVSFFVEYYFDLSPDLRIFIISSLIVPSVIYCSLRLYDPLNYLRTLLYCLAIALIVSYIGIVAFPARAIHTLTVDRGLSLNEQLIGSWRGVFAHKNIAGGVFMYLTIGSFFLSLYSKIKNSERIAFAFIFISSCTFQYMTDSTSSFFSPPAALLIFGILYFLTMNNLRRFVPEGIASAYVAFPFLFLALRKATGFTFDFDGRATIWDVAMSYGNVSPLIGHGFMNGLGSASIAKFLTTWWLPLIGHAHSVSMDLYVQFGCLGLLILWLIVRNAFSGYMELISAPDSDFRFLHSIIMILFLAGLIRSVVEPDMLMPRGPTYLFLSLILYPSAFKAVSSQIRVVSKRAAKGRVKAEAVFPQT